MKLYYQIISKRNSIVIKRLRDKNMNFLLLKFLKDVFVVGLLYDCCTLFAYSYIRINKFCIFKKSRNRKTDSREPNINVTY